MKFAVSNSSLSRLQSFIMSGESNHHTLLFAAAAALLGLVVVQQVNLYLARRKFKQQRGCKPAKTVYKRKDPIFGIDHITETIAHGRNHTMLEYSHNRYEKLGTTFEGKILRVPTFYTIEPDNVKSVLSTNFKDWSLKFRQRGTLPFLGLGIFTTDGEAWSHSRALIRPNFARDQVADLDAFETHVKDLFEAIPRDGSTVDLQDLFFKFTIDSATEFLFGESTRSLKPGANSKALDASFADAFNTAQLDCAERLRMGKFSNWRKNDPKAEDAIKICHAYVDQFVDMAVQYREKKNGDVEKQPKQKYVFLEHLAESTTDKKRLRDELLNVLLAGRDTTASLLSNMFLQIAKEPRIWNKLQEEVASLGGSPPSYSQLRDLKYLKYCLNECKSPQVS
jgi:cytochrome P450